MTNGKFAPADQGNASDNTDAGLLTRVRSKRVMVSAAVLVVVLAACGVGGYVVWDRHVRGVDLARCQSLVDSVKRQSLSPDTVRDADDVHEALAVKSGQVVDVKTLDALASEVTAFEKAPAMPFCDGSSRQEARQAADKAQELLTARKDAIFSIDTAVKAVNTSRDAKTLADARNVLAQAVKDAQGAFDSSDGKVADTATRDRLREALDAANKVLADESVKDPKRYQDVRASLADPVNQVNESVNAKASADQAAAAAAAQAQAQAPAQSQPRRRSSSGSGSGSSSPRRSSGSPGSGSSNHGSTGSGTTPNTGKSNAGGGSSSGSGSGSGSSGSSSGGGSWRDQFNNNDRPPQCEKGGACPIG